MSLISVSRPIRSDSISAMASVCSAQPSKIRAASSGERGVGMVLLIDFLRVDPRQPYGKCYNTVSSALLGNGLSFAMVDRSISSSLV